MFKKKFYSALFLLLTLCLSLQILPGHAHAASGGDTACHLSNCTCSNCGWKYLYVPSSADVHLTHIACTTCSAAFGVSNDPHTFSGDTCTLCGYVRSSSGGGDTSCSHGRYTYNCEYYNSRYHYVSKVCRDCGEEVDYFQENHSLRDSFSQYDANYHNYESYCTECNETIESSREAHNWSYSYRTYSGTEHRVDRTCHDCDYSTTDYENHRDSNGDGYCDDCDERLSMTVTWNAGTNGGTVNGSSSVTTTVNSGSVASAPGYTPVKTGYTFKGWYTAASGGSLYSTVSVTAARTFYAQFNASSYMVTWNANGGTPASSTTSQTYGATLTLPTAPTRTGYTFAGWYTSASGGTQVTSSTTYNKAGTTTYYAHWTAKSNTITWNAGSNGGTVNGQSSVTTTVNTGSSAAAPSYTPVKTGHTFKGWYTAASGGSLYNTVTIFDARTFYAQFNAISYTVTWNANGGTPASSTSSQDYGAKLTLPTAPSRAGYAFAGWYTSASGGTQVTGSTTYSTAGATTYYAHWNANANTVTWNASNNGGTVNGQNSVTTSVNTGAKATAPSYTPVKAGHTFKGWYTSATGGNLYSTVTVSAAQTFYAQFTANSYTATWNANGGTPASTTTSPSYGAKLTLPTQPTKAGYAFAGWYTAANGGTQVTSSTTYNTAGNVTYHAHWTTNSYTVTWNMGDGKTETTNQGYGEKLVMPSGSPVKAGHTFLGWFTAEKGGTEVTENTTYTTDGPTTYYAQFTANHYSITWDLGDGKTETTGQTYGEKLILPTEPTKDGYSFLGWFTEKDDGKGTKVDENTIYTNAGVGNYYAHWARVTKFSVAVPVVLPLAVSEDGEIHAATGQAIRNSSTGDIKVSSVTVNAGNGWKLVPFTTNMAAEKVDAKKIGFSINDIETTKNGNSEALKLSGNWTVKEDGNLPLEYDAVVSAMSKSVTDESILTVVFVLEWA